MWHEPRSCLFSTFLARDPDGLARRTAPSGRQPNLYDQFLQYHDLRADGDLGAPVHFLPPWASANRHQTPNSFFVLLMQHVTLFRDSERDPAQNFHGFVANYNGAWFVGHWLAQLAEVRRDILRQQDALALAAWDLTAQPVFAAWRRIKHQLHRRRDTILAELDAAAEHLVRFPHTPPGMRTYWRHVPNQVFPFAALHLNLAAPHLSETQVTRLALWLQTHPRPTATDAAVPFPDGHAGATTWQITAWDRSTNTITLSRVDDVGYADQRIGLP